MSGASENVRATIHVLIQQNDATSLYVRYLTMQSTKNKHEGRYGCIKRLAVGSKFGQKYLSYFGLNKQNESGKVT